jgi:DNA repair photolyase
MILNTGLRTDIPGFFSEWFYNRIDEGFVYVRNPYAKNQIYSYKLDPALIDCIIFCTKNPKPMFENLEKIDKFNQYWHITITPYEKEIEPNVPPVDEVLESFKYLSKRLGKENVTLRYDPIFINEKYTLEKHIESFEYMINSLSGYTTEAIISFIDLYEKTKRNFPQAREVTKDERLKIGKEFARIGNENNIRIKTCVEGTELDKFGIDSSGCMTKEVIERAINKNLNIPKQKARNGECYCLLNNDIGEYNTCNHGCLYCYANSNKKLVKRNLKLHDPKSPILIGKIKEDDIIKEMSQKSHIINDSTRQTKLF